MILRTTLVALLLATAACGSDGDDDKKTEDSGTDAGGKPDGGASPVDATVGVDTSVPLQPNKVTNTGAACTTANNCQGESPSCMQNLTVVTQQIAFPGGYCSAPCKGNTECGATAECPVAESLKGLPSIPGFDLTTFIPSNCFVPCTSDSQCRTSEKYRCASILSAITEGASLNLGPIDIGSLLMGPIKDSTYCLPPAPPRPDAGADASTPSSDAGAADTGAADTGADASQGDV